MAASNSLGEQFKLYHSSNQEFKPGDYIKPGAMVPPEIKSRTKGRWSDDFPEQAHDQWVWMSENPENTHSYGKHLYEVQPEGLTTHPTSLFGTAQSLAPVKVLRKGRIFGAHPNNPLIPNIEWEQ